MARRPMGRHARPGRRATPRRWLPFLLLVAVTVAAVAVSRQSSEPSGPDEPAATVAAASKLPVAGSRSAVSSTWFCAGGTAVGDDGTAELSVVIANAHDRGVQAEVTVFGTGGSRRRAAVEVPANDRVRVVGREVLEADWIGMVVEVFGGRATVDREIAGSDGFDVGPCSSTAAARWFVPSGSTLRGATERLVLFNPFPAATTVDVRFATEDGALQPRALQGVSVPGRSLRVVTVENPARRREVAAVVTARTGRIVVDRVQTYDGTGDPVTGQGEMGLVTDPPRGLVSTPAVPTAAERWFFPEARVLEGGRTQVAVHNPGGRTAEVNVVVTPEEPSRYPEVEPVQLSLRPGAETVVDLSELFDIPTSVGLTVDVRSLDGVPVVAELLQFTGDRVEERVPEEAPAEDAEEDHDHEEGDGAPAEEVPAVVPVPSFGPGVAVSAGSPVAATEWFLAGRSAGPPRDSLVVVANPGPKDLEVRVLELVGGKRRRVREATVVVPAGDRRALDLSDTAPTSALLIRSDGGVVVARTVAATTGIGTALSLATPLPEAVLGLPAYR